ncbi:MAG: DedA family protein [Campylobacterales bacterium]|nr:DedA family protein [Campylobacterales bacterium]
MLAEVTQWIISTVGEWGYTGILVMMAIESSFIPFPSEVVMIPAGYLCYKGEMSLPLVLTSGFAGSMIGAWVNYFLAMSLGRKFLYAYGAYFFMKPPVLEKIERFFKAHGAVSTFSGRLIPGIRQLISIPAGFSKMPLGLFSFYTFLGAGLWSSALVFLGYFMGEKEVLIKSYVNELVWAALALVFVIAAVYIYLHKRARKADQ